MSLKLVPTAHVELFKRDERTGKQVLVHTSRPCPVCRQPIDGIEPVVPASGNQQVHARCRVRLGAPRRMNG